MKKSHYSLLVIIPLLTCCKQVVPLEHQDYQPLETSLITFKDESGDIYYRNKDIQTLNINSYEGVDIKTEVTSVKDLNDVTRGFNENNYSLMSYNPDDVNGIIEKNILVVPAYFTDSDVADNLSLRAEKRLLIENAFFGGEKYTTYNSVASYYNKSSYGHLRLKGEILDWFNIGESSQTAYASSMKSPETYSDKVIKNIVDSLTDDIWAKYCSQHQGTIDALFVIYDHPYDLNKKNGDDSLFWAYTYHCKSTNKASVYAWASFDFMGDDVLTTHRVDASTYIHETGHILGLLDYYNKGNISYYQPLGFMDMMDYNLGDHSPLSKYLLNWTSPYILNMGDKSEGTISIKSFTESGDFILIPTSSFNGTAYDRYLLISFYSPTGLNDLSKFPSYEYTAKDGEKGIFTYPNQYGVLVHEVNAKLGFFQSDLIRMTTPKSYIDVNPGSGTYGIYFHDDNKIDRNSDIPLYRLLESSGKNTFMEGHAASNKTLFKLNDTFGEETYLELASEFGVSFKVSKLTTKEARITFTKVG